MSDRDTIGFSQQNAAAQMNELEERMFRLSEALRGLEPENASRLRLALKFSREEQILEQMRETHKLLKDAQLSKAETETKELIAKLEHLRNLLLAEDLDFQLKLARLRQMRETLGQLERIVKEERRELGWSRFAMEQRKRLARFTTRRPDLEALVRDQQAVIADTKNTSKNGDEVGEGRPGGDPRARGETPKRGGRPCNRPIVRGPSAAPPASRRRPAGRGGDFPGRGRLERRRRAPRIRHWACCARSSLAWTNRWHRRSERSPRPNSGAAPEIKPRTAARPKASRRPRPGWETSAWPCEKT